MTGIIEVLDGSATNYDPPGTEPEFDIIAKDEGSLTIFFPHTVTGGDWLDTHLPEDCPMAGKGYVVEARYVLPIVEGIINDGLNLKMGWVN